MHILESHLQSKSSPVPDDGGEDRIVVTEHYAAVIDGTMSKTNSQYQWKGKACPPGMIGAEILAQAVTELDPDLGAREACQFLDNKIRQTYIDGGYLDDMTSSPVERFSAIMAFYNHKRRYVVLGGECQAIIEGKHHQILKKTDILNSAARSKHIQRLINEGALTEDALKALPINEDPGRKLLLDPPPNSPFPGLRGQAQFQNNIGSPYGFFIFDGFANFSVPGFASIDVPDYATEVILMTRGYLSPLGTYPADSLYSLRAAEQSLQDIIDNDPCAYKMYLNTKSKGTDCSFDDRAYLRLSVEK